MQTQEEVSDSNSLQQQQQQQQQQEQQQGCRERGTGSMLQLPSKETLEALRLSLQQTQLSQAHALIRGDSQRDSETIAKLIKQEADIVEKGDREETAEAKQKGDSYSLQQQINTDTLLSLEEITPNPLRAELHTAASAAAAAADEVAAAVAALREWRQQQQQQQQHLLLQLQQQQQQEVAVKETASEPSDCCLLTELQSLSNSILGPPQAAAGGPPGAPRGPPATCSLVESVRSTQQKSGCLLQLISVRVSFLSACPSRNRCCCFTRYLLLLQ